MAIPYRVAIENDMYLVDMFKDYNEQLVELCSKEREGEEGRGGVSVHSKK